mgnify:FL=1
MKFPTNTFKRAIVQNKSPKQVGLWISMCSNYAAEVISGADNLNWVCIDNEHSPNDIKSTMSQIQAFQRNKNINIMARPTNNNPVEIKRLLDIGVNGLIIPMVNTVEEAELAVSATRYPPLGIRGVAGLVRASNYGRYTDYFEHVNNEICTIIQIETKEAIDNIENIANVNGVVSNLSFR